MPLPVVEATATTVSAGTVTSLAVNMPGTPVSGKLLFFHISTALDAAVTTPAGWTAIVAVGDGFGGNRIATFRRPADGTEGATVTVTVGSCTCTATAYLITGHDPLAPVNASATNSTTSNAGTVTCPTVTTTVPNCLLLRGAATRLEAGTVVAPAGYTDVGAVRTGTSSADSLSDAGYLGQAAPAATGTVTFTGLIGTKETVSYTVAVAAPLDPTVSVGNPIKRSPGRPGSFRPGLAR